eukprot:3887811-Alexandrium_andersonii.AAC.1
MPAKAGLGHVWARFAILLLHHYRRPRSHSSAHLRWRIIRRAELGYRLSGASALAEAPRVLLGFSRSGSQGLREL